MDEGRVSPRACRMLARLPPLASRLTDLLPSLASLLLRNVSKTQVLHFEELLDAVFRALAADAALLDAAERRDLGRDDALVDADDAVFELFGDAPDAADVAAVEIRREAELGVVGHADRLVLALEAEERGDGA